MIGVKIIIVSAKCIRDIFLVISPKIVVKV